MMKRTQLIGVLGCLVALTACRGGGQLASDNDHPNESTLQLIGYSENFEVFAEAEPFVVGQPSKILAHVTLLNNFKPITRGSMVVSLVVGNDGIRQNLQAPTRSGIYHFMLTPQRAGTGEITFEIESDQGRSKIVLPGIMVYTDIQEAQYSADSATINSSNGVIFTKEQSWKVDFSTQQAQLEPFGAVIHTTGRILPSQGDQRVVAAKTSGMVTFIADNLLEGRAVRTAEALLSINSEGMAENDLSVRLSEAAAEYNRAKGEYARKAALAVDQIVSQSELLKAQSELAQAEAQYNSLRRNFGGGRQTITSPLSGYITRLMVSNGGYVEAGDAVMVVSQHQNLLIKAELQPKYYPLLSQISGATFCIIPGNLLYSLEELGGSLLSYGHSSEWDNPLIPVIFQVKNSIGLLPGSFVELYIKIHTNNLAVTIPNKAIIEEMGNYFIYAQLTPELFEKRAIRKGATDGYKTEVLEGVKAGDRLVCEGAILVKLAQGSSALDAHSGHVH